MKTISELIEQIKDTHERELQSTIKCSKEGLARQIANTEMMYQAAALLSTIGINLDISSYTARWGTTIALKEATDISKVVQAIGPVKFAGTEPKDASKSIVTKSFKSVHFPTLRFEIDFKLPSPRSKAGKALKCKFVKRRVTQVDLVCSR